MHKISANLAVGLNCPVSIELIVFRDTPTISANADWESFCSALIFFKLFFKIYNKNIWIKYTNFIFQFLFLF